MPGRDDVTRVGEAAPDATRLGDEGLDATQHAALDPEHTRAASVAGADADLPDRARPVSGEKLGEAERDGYILET